MSKLLSLQDIDELDLFVLDIRQCTNALEAISEAMEYGPTNPGEWNPAIKMCTTQIAIAIDTIAGIVKNDHCSGSCPSEAAAREGGDTI